MSSSSVISSTAAKPVLQGHASNIIIIIIIIMVEYQNVRGTIMSSRTSTSSIARGKKSTLFVGRMLHR